MKNLATFFLIFLFVFTSSCRAPLKSEARAILESKNIKFTNEAFFDNIQKNNTEIVELFIDGGIDIEQNHSALITPLIMAVEFQSYETMELLLKNGANIGTLSEQDEVPALVYAIMVCVILDGDLKIVKLLLDNGADPNFMGGVSMARTPMYSTPLMAAISGRKERENKSTSVIKLLMGYGAEINLFTPFKLTVLDEAMYSYSNPNKKIIKFLRSLGAKTGAEIIAEKGADKFEVEAKKKIIIAEKKAEEKIKNLKNPTDAQENEIYDQLEKEISAIHKVEYEQRFQEYLKKRNLRP